MNDLNHSRRLAARLCAAGMLLAIAGSALATVRYVDGNSTNATPPYTNWTTAATQIQDAVDAAVAGDEIVVTNGTYASGGRAVYGTLTNRVAVDKPLALRSISGPQFTIIQGWRPGTNNGDGAIRCVYLTNGASLTGFALTNGATRMVNDFPTNRESCGGGLWCESTNGVVVSNCVVAGNSAYFYGAGAFGGTLDGCALIGNMLHDAHPGVSPPAVGGAGAAYCTLNSCTITSNLLVAESVAWPGVLGGGAYQCALNDCTLGGNSVQNIQGVPYNSGAYGGGAAYCTLNGCIVTNNLLVGGSGSAYGGGAYQCTLSTCTLGGNFVQNFHQGDAYGGGAAYCTLDSCTLITNLLSGGYNPSAAYGGGAYQCTLSNCTLSSNAVTAQCAVSFCDGLAFGGGASYCTLNNCRLRGNSSGYYGGGAYRGTLNNCVLIGNSAQYSGAAVFCMLNNCTLTGNSARFSGGADSSTLNNCIVLDAASYSTMNYCWTTAPLFVDQAAGDLRLQSNSPCINAGNNSFVTNATDLDGNPRIAGGTVDIGAYEFQAPASLISYAWLQRFNLPISPATDTADPDGDGVDNYHEWLAGTDPTNPLSSPAQLAIIPSGTNVLLSWSTNAVHFTLQSATNLVSPAAWSTNSAAPVVIGGQNTVTNPFTGPQQFYRLVH